MKPLAVALTLLLVCLLPVSACAATKTATHRLPADPNAVAFSYTTPGMVNFITVVSIYVGGRVDIRLSMSAGGGICPIPARAGETVSHAKQLRLMHLADSSGYFSLPRVIKGQMGVDVVGPSITIRTATGTKHVYEMLNVANPIFNRLYSALRRAAPIADACRGGPSFPPKGSAGSARAPRA